MSTQSTAGVKLATGTVSGVSAPDTGVPASGPLNLGQVILNALAPYVNGGTVEKTGSPLAAGKSVPAKDLKAANTPTWLYPVLFAGAAFLALRFI